MSKTFLLSVLILVHSWYPKACCGGADCKPVPCDQLVETEKGWTYLPTHDLFAWDMVQPSQDKQCHICINPNGNRPLCAFIQQSV
jgi:hypothetical protein